MATNIRVRMYKVGELGDCFFLTITNGNTKKHMLIDCGSFRNSGKSIARMQEIANDIKNEVGHGNLDIVVGTHQHNDHVSGFVHAEDIFKQANIEQVWLSWLDDPKSKEATSIAQGHTKLRSLMGDASKKLAAIMTRRLAEGKHKETKMVSNVSTLVSGVLEFFGDAPEVPAQGIAILKEIGKQDPEYLSPGEMKTIPGIPESELRIHILGPPTNEKLLFRKDPKKGESYEMKLNSMQAMAQNFLLALDNLHTGDSKEEVDFPFNNRFKRLEVDYESSSALKEIVNLYQSPANSWRNIDEDWMEQASRIALYMDSFTNNSSLALAIELVKSGKVLLFAADAQIGNWVSWNDIKFEHKSTSIDSLLERTVFYKVGHHGSHNSTLKEALEKMTSDELIAMIPVDKKDPNITKENGWKMPAKNLYKRLKEKTKLRVLRMDDGYADGCNPQKSSEAKKSWAKLKHAPKITDSYVEITI